MTDKELIQALRCCGYGDCADCPAYKTPPECNISVTYEGAADRLEDLAAENEHLREATKMMPQWVSVNDRLPEHGKTVLVYCDSVTIESRKTVHIGSCDRLCGIPCWFLRNEIGIASYPNRDWSVTHWMPLPEFGGEDRNGT